MGRTDKGCIVRNAFILDACSEPVVIGLIVKGEGGIALQALKEDQGYRANIDQDIENGTGYQGVHKEDFVIREESYGVSQIRRTRDAIDFGLEEIVDIHKACAVRDGTQDLMAVEKGERDGMNHGRRSRSLV